MSWHRELSWFLIRPMVLRRLERRAICINGWAGRCWIRATGIERVYTGHCTGTKAFQILKEELGDQVEQLSTGLVMEF